MQFLLVLGLCIAQSDVTEIFPQTGPDVVQERVAPPQPPAPGEVFEQLVPNEIPTVPHDDRQLQDGPLLPGEPEVFMPPEAAGTDPLQNFGPPHGSQFGPHHGRTDLHQERPEHGGPQARFGMGPGRQSQGCMPGAGGSAGCQPPHQSFGNESFASDASCQSCQTCQPSCQTCQPPGCQGHYGCLGCNGCLSGCPLFGCWHLCNCCDPCTRKRLQAKYCGTPGDMYPESPYFPVNHGNYYFRPYTYAHIGIQQQIASRWGADPRAPYQSELFCHLYSEMGIPLPYADSDEEDSIPSRDRKPSDHFTTVP